MRTTLSSGRLAMVGCLLLLSVTARGQNAFSPGGNDYPIAGSLAGDQSAPGAAMNSSGGYLVWQDNATDGNGLGIRAERLDRNMNKSGSAFRVNSISTYDQEKPQVAMLTNGGAVIVWQGGRQGFQRIYARFLTATQTNTLPADILVNTYTNHFQINPAVATLTDGSVVVVWSSYGQDLSLQGVYAQRFTSAGVKTGSEFQVNQFISNNQRTPSVAALTGGGFVVAWVSELQSSASSVDIYARVFNASGVAVGGEFRVNSVNNIACANPSVAGSPDGGFAVAWSQREGAIGNSSSQQFNVTVPSPGTVNSWDVFARTFNSSGVAVTAPVRLNTLTYGDQYAPRISSFGKSYLAAWLSLGQDGSMEGIFGQFFASSGELAGVEFRVNTGNASRQIDPIVCSDGVNQFMVAWSSFANSGNFDLFARAYDLIRVDIVPTAQGVRLTWNSRAGCRYQVQSSSNYATWVDVGSVRTATGLSDSVDLASPGSTSLYRVVRVQ